MINIGVLIIIPLFMRHTEISPSPVREARPRGEAFRENAIGYFSAANRAELKRMGLLHQRERLVEQLAVAPDKELRVLVTKFEALSAEMERLAAEARDAMQRSSDWLKFVHDLDSGAQEAGRKSHPPERGAGSVN